MNAGDRASRKAIDGRRPMRNFIRANGAVFYGKVFCPGLRFLCSARRRRAPVGMTEKQPNFEISPCVRPAASLSRNDKKKGFAK